MVDNGVKSEESKTLFAKEILKYTKNGQTSVGRILVETKVFDGHKFIQITQDKNAFGNTPAKKSWVTFDPTNEDIVKAIFEACKA